MRHEVYYNLHKKCLSYRRMPFSRDGIKYNAGLVEHASDLLLEDVVFAVQPAGRRRVVIEQRKNVHAFVRGILLSGTPLVYDVVAADWYLDEVKSILSHPGVVEVTYNPYSWGVFYDRNTLTPVHSADRVYIVGKAIYAVGVK